MCAVRRHVCCEDYVLYDLVCDNHHHHHHHHHHQDEAADEDEDEKPRGLLQQRDSAVTMTFHILNSWKAKRAAAATWLANSQLFHHKKTLISSWREWYNTPCLSQFAYTQNKMARKATNTTMMHFYAWNLTKPANMEQYCQGRTCCIRFLSNNFTHL